MAGPSELEYSDCNRCLPPNTRGGGERRYEIKHSNNPSKGMGGGGGGITDREITGACNVTNSPVLRLQLRIIIARVSDRIFQTGMGKTCDTPMCGEPHLLGSLELCFPSPPPSLRFCSLSSQKILVVPCIWAQKGC